MAYLFFLLNETQNETPSFLQENGKLFSPYIPSMLQTVKCNKCSKGFSASYSSIANAHLQRHLAKKKPCIREVPIRSEAHDLSRIELDFDGSKLSSALFQVFDKYNSVCQSNTSRDIISYYLNGEVHHSSLAQFIHTIWYDFLIPRVFPILKERGWDFEKNGFECDVSSPHMKKSLSIGRYQESDYFNHDFYRYVEKNKFYPIFRSNLSEYFTNVPKQRRSEIKALLLSQACQPRT